MKIRGMWMNNKINNKKFTINACINLCCLILIFFNKEILNSQTRIVQIAIMFIIVLVIFFKDSFLKEPIRKLLKEKFEKSLSIFEYILNLIFLTTIFMWINNHLNVSFYFSLIILFLTLLVEDIVMGILSKKYL